MRVSRLLLRPSTYRAPQRRLTFPGSSFGRPLMTVQRRSFHTTPLILYRRRSENFFKGPQTWQGSGIKISEVKNTKVEQPSEKLPMDSALRELGKKFANGLTDKELLKLTNPPEDFRGRGFFQGNKHSFRLDYSRSYKLDGKTVHVYILQLNAQVEHKSAVEFRRKYSTHAKAAEVHIHEDAIANEMREILLSKFDD